MFDQTERQQAKDGSAREYTGVRAGPREAGAGAWVGQVSPNFGPGRENEVRKLSKHLWQKR
jgi:hypothetical protein